MVILFCCFHLLNRVFQNFSSKILIFLFHFRIVCNYIFDAYFIFLSFHVSIFFVLIFFLSCSCFILFSPFFLAFFLLSNILLIFVLSFLLYSSDHEDIIQWRQFLRVYPIVDFLPLILFFSSSSSSSHSPYFYFSFPCLLQPFLFS